MKLLNENSIVFSFIILFTETRGKKLWKFCENPGCWWRVCNMHLKSDNKEFKAYDNVNDIVGKLFKAFL